MQEEKFEQKPDGVPSHLRLTGGQRLHSKYVYNIVLIRLALTIVAADFPISSMTAA